jgi:hypothetical protein
MTKTKFLAPGPCILPLVPAGGRSKPSEQEVHRKREKRLHRPCRIAILDNSKSDSLQYNDETDESQYKELRAAGGRCRGVEEPIYRHGTGPYTQEIFRWNMTQGGKLTCITCRWPLGGNSWGELDCMRGGLWRRDVNSWIWTSIEHDI